MWRTALLLGLLTGILLAIGYFLGGPGGMTLFLFISLAINFASYWWSDKIVLAMYKAKEIPKRQNPKLHKIVERVAKAADIPKPKVYMINETVPNAFATGRNPKNAIVAVTSGIMKMLKDDEIEGVIAHEIAHIKNRDTLTSTIAASVAGAISYIAQMAWYGMYGRDERGRGSMILLPLLILAPISATLIQLAISRGREFEADKYGALFSKKPLSLASALEKISGIVKHNPMRGNPATSHLFIINPFKGDLIFTLFSTHPGTGERVKKLREMKI